jgi:hypothetical protein
MEINDYQAQIRNFIDYHTELGPFSVILELMNNVGILSSKLHKVLEVDKGTFSDLDKNKTIISLGDIIADISNIASDLNVSMDEILALNLRKQAMLKEKKIREEDMKAVKPVR